MSTARAPGPAAGHDFQRRRLAVRLFGWAARLAQALAALPQRLVPPPFRLMQLGSAYWHSRALAAAAGLGVADALGERTLDTATLAAAVGADADALARLLRLLAALGLFDEPRPGHWRNNRGSQPLRRDAPHSVRAMVLLHHHPALARPWWDTLEAGLRRGAPALELHHGRTMLGVMAADPALAALFAQAMDQVEALTGDAPATAFDWRAFDRVIDLGGSTGGKAMSLLKHHPHLQALVVDLPATIALAPTAWAGRAEAALLPRLQFQAGDLTTDVPPARGPRDCYLLSAVLHGMDDATAIGLLQRVAARARAAGAALAVMELVLPEGRIDAASAAIDLQMLVATRGRERRLSQWQALFARAGLALQQQVRLPSLGSVLLLRPAR